MALVTLPSNNNPVEIIAAGGKGIVQNLSGPAVIENAADPTNGIALRQGETIALDGWAAAWNGQSVTTGKAVVLRVATE